jgi:hypothetical protein
MKFPYGPEQEPSAAPEGHPQARGLFPQFFALSGRFKDAAASFTGHQFRRKTQNGSPVQEGEFTIGLKGFLMTADLAEVSP